MTQLLTNLFFCPIISICCLCACICSKNNERINVDDNDDLVVTNDVILVNEINRNENLNQSQVIHQAQVNIINEPIKLENKNIKIIT